MIKKFQEFLNESKTTWEERVRIAKKKKTSSKYGLTSMDIFEEIVLIIDSGNIYGQKVPGYPFIIAVSGTGDDYGNDEAWVIKNPEDFYRWVTTAETGNKQFPSLSGKDYLPHPSQMTKEDLDDIIEDIKDKNYDQDDFQNGYNVKFFKNKQEMDKAVEDSLACLDCEGEGEYEGEECENCEGTGKFDQDDIEYSDLHDDILDGSFFPPRSDFHTNW